MVQHVLILMVATLVFVLMVGRETIAVKTLTIVLMLHVLTEQRVLMALETLHADVLPEKQDYYVIWTMLAPRILVMLMQFAKQVLLMVPSHVHVHKVTRDRNVRTTLMNVSKVKYFFTF